MHIFYSGTGGSNGSMAERILADANDGKGPCIMLTHDEIYLNRSHATRRFDNIKQRRLGQLEDDERVWMHFLDSGAFGLFNREVKQEAFLRLFKTKKLNLEVYQSMAAGERSAFKRENRGLFRQSKESIYQYYDSPAFWDRVDEYAWFVKQNKIACDYYANLDVLYHPELSWKVQQCLEDDYKLQPVPIIHSGTPLAWVRHYLRLGYEFIGLGGFGQQRMTAQQYLHWASEVFQILCPPPSRKPIVRVHGFAMTNFELLMRFPWWSVDSATWTKAASYGSIYVPKYKGGKYVFNEPPMMVRTSSEVSSKVGSKMRTADKEHFMAWAPHKKKIVTRWLDKLEVPLGSVDKWGDRKTFGVLSHYAARMEVNLRFFDLLEKSMPEWPATFTRASRVCSSFPIKV